MKKVEINDSIISPKLDKAVIKSDNFEAIDIEFIISNFNNNRREMKKQSSFINEKQETIKTINKPLDLNSYKCVF